MPLSIHKKGLRPPTGRFAPSATPHPISKAARLIPNSEVEEVQKVIFNAVAGINEVLRKVEKRRSESVKRASLLQGISEKLRGKIAEIQAQLSAMDTLNPLLEELQLFRVLNASNAQEKDRLIQDRDQLQDFSNNSLQGCRRMHQLVQTVRSRVRVVANIFEEPHESSTAIIPNVLESNTDSVPSISLYTSTHIFDHVFGLNEAKSNLLNYIFSFVHQSLQDSSNVFILCVGDSGENAAVYGRELINKVIAEFTGSFCRVVRVSAVKVERSEWIPIIHYDELAFLSDEIRIHIMEHVIFQILISSKNNTSLLISFAFPESINAPCCSPNEELFIHETYNSLSEILKSFVSLKYKTACPSCFRAPFLKELRPCLQDSSRALVLCNLASCATDNTHAALSFLRDSALLI